ncbi:MAG: 3'-5' exonuclease [Gemmatimonadota bacterium]|nr:3'-5' exonuclease [Gemmatimonadota bacterium]
MSPLAPRGGELREAARTWLEVHGAGPPEALAREVFGMERLERVLAQRLLGTLLGGDPAFELVDGRWRLAPAKRTAAPRPLRSLPFTVVDVETTGGSPPADRVIEVAAVRTRGGRVEEEWSSLVDPDRPVPAFVARLTGIDEARLTGAPRFAEIADAFLEILGGTPFVAHNAPFDWRFLNAELLRARGGCLTNARVCTLRLARRLMPEYRRRNLDALAHAFGIPIEGRHRALGDARATARILARLLDLAAERGVEDERGLAKLCGIGGTLYPDPAV